MEDILQLTPFDDVIENIKGEHYHNHRKQNHSDIVSEGIYRDLLIYCPELKYDIENQMVKKWLNVDSPTSRKRKMDLLIGQPNSKGKPDLEKVRICIENKSVITAHRNKDARYDDLNEVLKDLHQIKSETITIATILVGIAPRVLNIPDGVKKRYKGSKKEFSEKIVPRLSSGDLTLWEEFAQDISDNQPKDPIKTIEKFNCLPTRHIGYTHQIGYDYILFVPVYVDNVNPPYLARKNELGLNIDSDYNKMLETICKAYNMRWGV